VCVLPGQCVTGFHHRLENSCRLSYPDIPYGICSGFVECDLEFPADLHAGCLSKGWLNITMLARYEETTSKAATTAATYVNEMTDSVKTIATLGRERETMRIFDLKTRATPKQWRCLILGSLGFGMVNGSLLCMTSLLFFWSSRRLADGVVSQERYH
jgi:hypothetical protein